LVPGSFYNDLEYDESPIILKLSLRLQKISSSCVGSKAINDPKVLLQKTLDPPNPQIVEDALSLHVQMGALEKTPTRGQYEPTFYGQLLASFLLSFDSSVLVLKFGDGGVLREVCRHSSVTHVDICEIDQMVIYVSKKYFQELAVGLVDPRVHLHVGDTVEFLRCTPEGKYDAIIVDSSNPVGPAHELVEKSIFVTLAKALRPGGVLCTMVDSMWLHTHLIMDMISNCLQTFASVRYGLNGSVPNIFLMAATFLYMYVHEVLVRSNSTLDMLLHSDVVEYELIGLMRDLQEVDCSLHFFFTQWDPGGWSLVHWRSQHTWEAIY
jgi:hypothetical protein